MGGGSGRDRQGLQCCRRVGLLLARVIVCVLMLQLVRVHVLLLQLFTAPDGSRGIQIDASGASSLAWRSGVLRALNLACHEANSDSVIFPARARARARARRCGVRNPPRRRAISASRKRMNSGV